MDSQVNERSEQKRSTPTQLDVDDFKAQSNFLHTGNISLHPALFFSHTDNFLPPNRMRGEYSDNNPTQNHVENCLDDMSLVSLDNSSGPWAQSVDMVMEQQISSNNVEKSLESDSNNFQPATNPMMKLNPQQKGQQLLHLLQRAKREHWNDIFVFCEQLETIPNALFEIQSLMLVDLRGNFLETVSSEIERLVMLEEVYLDSNKLKEIPIQLASIPSLRVLSFSRNKLTRIPKELSRLTNLTKLDVSYNLLTQIPPEFSSLANRQPDQPGFVMIIEHNPLIDLAPSLYPVIANVVASPSNPEIRMPVSLPFPVQIGHIRLFIGDHQSESNIAALQYRSITHIVIADSELTPHYEQQFVYSHLNIPIVDDTKSILSALKNEALFQFISEASHDANRGVLLCCQNGATRSAAIAIGFLMRLWNMNASKAAQTLQLYYPLIHLTPEIIQQLQEYQQYLEHQDTNTLADSLRKL